MTDEAKTARALRAVTSPGRWMPGMLAVHGEGYRGRVVRVVASQIEVAEDGRGRLALWYASEALPDFDDPATLGCLLALVREAWRDPNAQVTRVSENGVWSAWRFKGHTRGRVGTREVWRDGATEAEALVAALEAAGVGR